MKFFVTGLCLQGNKGGPALALSLMKVLRREIPGAEFVFSVPPEPEFQFELDWARKYNVSVVEDFWEVGWVFSPWRVLKDGMAAARRRYRVRRAWFRAMRESDVVLDMTAIGYVGPPEGSEEHALNMRYRYFKAAKRSGRVFRAWTQSYGPFSTSAIEQAAREDFASLPCVYCRGQESLNRVRALLPGKECRSYPDVAVVLNYDRQRGKQLVLKAFGKYPDRRLITFSPSSVQYSKLDLEAREQYVQQRVMLVERLLDQGYAVLFVPHAMRPLQNVPWLCDQAVCQAIHFRIRPDPWVALLMGDYSAVDLKSVISCADVHIGARYHSVVAALSSGVPTISLSWHHKYVDVMEIYQQTKYVVDGSSARMADECLAMVAELMSEREGISKVLGALQPTLEDAVCENARHLAQGLAASESRLMPVSGMTKCRVCGSGNIHQLGVVEYVSGFPSPVADCANCGCRFTPHDSSVHELLHQSGGISVYAQYRDLAADAARLFAARDRAGLRQYLGNSASKYGFVLDMAAQLPHGAACLEIGCSRGYLTSSLILDGKDVLGLDVSTEAISSAQELFGDYFALPDSERAVNGGPYDLIYHVGLIGCVDDPIGLTKMLLAKLKPGGRLVFNSPNRAACVLRGQLWFDTAQPPDLVTLFPQGFWKKHFGDEAIVSETAESRSAEESFRLRLSRWAGRSWKAPLPLPLGSSSGIKRIWHQPASASWRLLERFITKAAMMTGVGKNIDPYPSDFGLFVTLQKRGD